MKKSPLVLMSALMLVARFTGGYGEVENTLEVGNVKYFEGHARLHAHLQQLSDTTETMQLLEYLAYLPKDNIPKALLVNLFESDSILENSLKILGCLLTTDSNTVSIDGPLQKAVMHSLTKDHKKILSNLAVICRDFDSFMMTDEAKAMAIYQQGQQDALDLNNYMDAAYFSRRLARIALDWYPDESGLQYATQAIQFYSMLDPPSDEMRMLESNILKARFHGFLGQDIEAIQEFLTVFVMYPEVRDESDPQDVQIYKHLAWPFRKLSLNTDNLNDLASYSSQLEILSLNMKTLDSDHPDLIPSYATGQVQWLPDDHATDFDKTPANLAERCSQKSMVIDQKKFGEMHLNTANSFVLMGWILNDQGQYLQSIQCQNQAVQIKRKIYTELHPDIARSYILLGECHEKLGNFSEALNAYSEAFKINELAFPDDHPVLVRNMQLINQGIALVEQYLPQP